MEHAAPHRQKIAQIFTFHVDRSHILLRLCMLVIFLMGKISYSVTQLLKYNLYTRLYEWFKFAKFLHILLINMLE